MPRKKGWKEGGQGKRVGTSGIPHPRRSWRVGGGNKVTQRTTEIVNGEGTGVVRALVAFHSGVIRSLTGSSPLMRT